MLSFIKFARLASLTFRRSDRRRSQLATHCAAELFETRIVLTTIALAPSTLAAVTMPMDPVAAAVPTQSVYSNAGVGVVTPSLPTYTAATIDGYTNGTNAANPVGTPSITVTAAIGNNGQITLTIVVSGLSGSATLDISGTVSSSGTSVSNGTSTMTVSSSSSGYATAQMKDTSGNNVGNSSAFMTPAP